VDRHVRLLGILAGLWGALAMLVGVSMLLESGGALVIWVNPDRAAVRFAAGLTAAVLAAVGVFALLWGGAHVWAGLLLRHRRAAGRLLTLGLAVVNLLVFPFGTAFGVYALWVLLTGDGRRLFMGTTSETSLPSGGGGVSDLR
jgi:hypothetical protein